MLTQVFEGDAGVILLRTRFPSATSSPYYRRVGWEQLRLLNEHHFEIGKDIRGDGCSPLLHPPPWPAAMGASSLRLREGNRVLWGGLEKKMLRDQAVVKLNERPLKSAIHAPSRSS